MAAALQLGWSAVGLLPGGEKKPRRLRCFRPEPPPLLVGAARLVPLPPRLWPLPLLSRACSLLPRPLLWAAAVLPLPLPPPAPCRPACIMARMRCCSRTSMAARSTEASCACCCWGPGCRPCCCCCARCCGAACAASGCPWCSDRSCGTMLLAPASPASNPAAAASGSCQGAAQAVPAAHAALVGPPVL